MFCEHCGKQLREQSVFCAYCGMKVNSEEEVTMQPAGNAAEPQVQSAENTTEQAVQMQLAAAASEQGTSAQSEVYVATADGVVPKGQQEEMEEELPEAHILGICSHEVFIQVVYNCFIKGASSDFLETQLRKKVKGGLVVDRVLTTPDGKYYMYVQARMGVDTRTVKVRDLTTDQVWRHEYVFLRKFSKAVNKLIDKEEHQNVL
ncbi:zinc ribbon domain-containing protein [Oliverpabstia sp.]|uniref:zinc ribbon domain-containing protein n=1 Tax=Oliverpabstia sp. TaxID=2815798 RepID=UPI002588C754|nr:zinc ribbon domain-containing protein [Oliverpabstia sp.]MCI5493857.1 zinc ribbon domain-containing protein [Lachnospiraceae bacterium]MCI7525235.1 zinc ribbon domain-containing protein [Oliverpabstia sp.]